MTEGFVRAAAAVACALTLVACNDPYVNIPYKPDPSVWAVVCGDEAVDWQDATCSDLTWQVPACGPAVTQDSVDNGHALVSLPTPLTYTESPPLSGPHRPDWARWGEYAFLPPQRWLYNLELGGVVVLYNPCMPPRLLEDLRVFLRDQSADDGGPYRWIITPYPGLSTPFLIATWQHGFAANCLDVAAASAFLQSHYRHAPQDSPLVGAYNYAWLGKSGALLTGPAAASDASCGDASSADAQ